MHYVYLLRVDNALCKWYIGSTKDIQRRFQEHVQGKVYTTRRLQKPELVYYEAYLDGELAKERERQLKRFGSAYTALLKRLGYKPS